MLFRIILKIYIKNYVLVKVSLVMMKKKLPMQTSVEVVVQEIS